MVRFGSGFLYSLSRASFDKKANSVLFLTIRKLEALLSCLSMETSTALKCWKVVRSILSPTPSVKIIRQYYLTFSSFVILWSRLISLRNGTILKEICPLTLMRLVEFFISSRSKEEEAWLPENIILKGDSILILVI